MRASRLGLPVLELIALCSTKKRMLGLYPISTLAARTIDLNLFSYSSSDMPLGALPPRACGAPHALSRNCLVCSMSQFSSATHLSYCATVISTMME